MHAQSDWSWSGWVYLGKVPLHLEWREEGFLCIKSHRADIEWILFQRSKVESSVSAHVQATLSKSHSDNGPENSVSRASLTCDQQTWKCLIRAWLTVRNSIICGNCDWICGVALLRMTLNLGDPLWHETFCVLRSQKVSCHSGSPRSNLLAISSFILGLWLTYWSPF